MKSLLKNIKFLAFFLGVALFMQGCSDDDEDQLPEVVANFTYTLNEDTGAVVFLNTSENADTYAWDLGDGTSSTVENPTKVYGTGTYTVVLTASNVAGASDTFESEIVVNIPVDVTMPFNFDSSNVNYNYSVFNGASFAIVDNPSVGGSNDSASQVGQITNSGAAYEGVVFALGEAVDLSTDKTVQLDFYSETPVSVLLKLEKEDGSGTEVLGQHGGTGWENMVFTFDSSDSYTKVVVFVDPAGTMAGSFYIDNIRQTSTVDTVVPVITLTGDNPQTITVGDDYVELGATASDNLDGDITDAIVIDSSAVDTSVEGSYTVTYNVTDAAGNVAVEVIRTVNVEAAATGGSAYCQTEVKHLNIDAETASAILLSIYNVNETTMRVEIKSADDDPVDLLVLPAGDFNPVPGISVNPADVGNGVWAAEFFYPDGAPENAELYILWSKESNAGNWQYGGPGADLLSVPFNSTCDSMAGGDGGGETPFDSGLLVNGDFENGIDPWINSSGLATDGDNTYFTANVGAAGNPWDFNLSQVLDITQGATYKLSFTAWSDVSRTILAGIGLNQDPWTNMTESTALTTEMQDFEYTFTAADFGGANSRVIFDMGAEAGMVNIDNVALFLVDDGTGGGGGGEPGENGCSGDLVDATAFPVTFEGCESFLSTFGTIEVTNDVNPDKTGINTSDYALKVTKNAGAEFWAGVQNNFPDTFTLSGGQKFRLKIYSTKANTPFRFEVAQDDPNVGNPPGKIITVAEANTWTEVEFSFDAMPAPDSYFRFVIKPNNDENDSDVTESGVYYFDDIEIVN